MHTSPPGERGYISLRPGYWIASLVAALQFPSITLKVKAPCKFLTIHWKLEVHLIIQMIFAFILLESKLQIVHILWSDQTWRVISSNRALKAVNQCAILQKDDTRIPLTNWGNDCTVTIPCKSLDALYWYTTVLFLIISTKVLFTFSNFHIKEHLVCRILFFLLKHVKTIVLFSVKNITTILLSFELKLCGSSNLSFVQCYLLITVTSK